jgi:hypothetical protein
MFDANRLERHAALQRLIETDVDLTHAAFAEAFENAVVGNEKFHGVRSPDGRTNARLASWPFSSGAGEENGLTM